MTVINKRVSVDLPRTGQRPLHVDGTVLVEMSSWHDAAERWHDLIVYRDVSGQYVVQVLFTSARNGELGESRVLHAKDPAELEAALRDVRTCPEGIGYPPGPQFVERQKRLEVDLNRRFDALITNVFAELGPEFAEHLAF